MSIASGGPFDWKERCPEVWIYISSWEANMAPMEVVHTLSNKNFLLPRLACLLPLTMLHLPAAETNNEPLYGTIHSLVAQRVRNLSACSTGDLGSIPELGRSPGEGHSNPLQYSCLENSMDRGAWQATVHRVAKSQTPLSN